MIHKIGAMDISYDHLKINYHTPKVPTTYLPNNIENPKNYKKADCS